MAGGNTDVEGFREMIPVRAPVKWLLTVVAVFSGVSLAAQVLSEEEGILERGGCLPGEVSVEVLVVGRTTCGMPCEWRGSGGTSI